MREVRERKGHPHRLATTCKWIWTVVKKPLFHSVRSNTGEAGPLTLCQISGSQIFHQHQGLATLLTVDGRAVRVHKRIIPLHSQQRFRSVAVITCASHAQGPRFDPGRKHFFFSSSHIFYFSRFCFFSSLIFPYFFPPTVTYTRITIIYQI